MLPEILTQVEEFSDYLALTMPNLSTKTRRSKNANNGEAASGDFGLSSDPSLKKIEEQLQEDEKQFQQREKSRLNRMEKLAARYYDEKTAKARARERSLYESLEEDEEKHDSDETNPERT